MSDCGASPGLPRVLAPAEALVGVGKAILRRELKPGAEAPSEADLTRELRIGTGSARRALDVLDVAGILTESLAASGPSAQRGHTLAETSGGGIDRLLRLFLLGPGGTSCAEILGIRTALERSAAAGAARTADAADIAAFHRIVDRMHQPGISPNIFRRLDSSLHLRIARASGNDLQEQLLRGLSDVVVDQMRQAFAASDDWPDTAHRLAEEHECLIAFIAEHRSADAADYVESHVHDFYRT